MTIDPHAFAAAAKALVGVPFRLHGRDPKTGLDCIGVFDAALRACGHPGGLPRGYSLRMTSLGGWLPSPTSLGFADAQGAAAAGDVVLLNLGPAQFHLAIAIPGEAWIHAHAGLRRVVQTSALPAGSVIRHWRPAPTI